ncbi:MAG: class I SAM-dependent methyltransferase [Anaerolineales bacterium]
MNLQIKHEDRQEIRIGTLICESCSSQFAIQDGVVELLPKLDKETLREREVRDLKERVWKVERQRPYINDNESNSWTWPNIAANVEQGLNQVILSGAMVLDIGAATCWSTRMMVERGAMAVALDISTGMLIDGESQFYSDVYFDRVAGSMTSLPFIEGSFNLTFASATIHHSGNLDLVFEEIERVLKPGGRSVMVNEPVLGLSGRRSQFGRDDIEQGMNEHIYRLAEYQRAAEKAGLVTWYLVPAGLEAQLRGEIPSPDTPIMNFIPNIWKWVPYPIQKVSLKVGDLLFGMPMTMIAEKKCV